MKFVENVLPKLAFIARRAALEAGSYIQKNVGEKHKVLQKTGAPSLASQVLTEIDLGAEQIILKHLAPTLDLYDLGLLSEETTDDLSRLQKDYFWAIDPLDGTLAFTRGLYGYAVSIGLVDKSGKSVVGIVYDPVYGHIYQSISSQGAWSASNKELLSPTHIQTNQEKLPKPVYQIQDAQVHKYFPTLKSNHEIQEYIQGIDFIQDPLLNPLFEQLKLNLNKLFLGKKMSELTLNPPVWIMDQSMMTASYFPFVHRLIESFFQNIGVEKFYLICQGGAAMNTLWVSQVPNSFYFKFPKTTPGGGSIWDFAASPLILNELGFEATSFHGESLFLNSTDSTYMNQQGFWASNIFT